ncbi:hypothetical protein [Plebeiibacterium marinum]|uniref:Uncharacterized protein n=1 Tax=Plebeiibacterium marinum TaxID=2992111 RepID=A0AAE3SHX1_9BACT|nr:hypothetical protein [Plebeiobacterium marinum]MCW3804125.1 hypothetical protein [Plebeiobacterium marinum]
MNTPKTTLAFLLILFLFSCSKNEIKYDEKIVLLHHSTGRIIYEGGKDQTFIYKAARKVNSKLANFIKGKPMVLKQFENYNTKNEYKYQIEEKTFPKLSPYGWQNYPYDYYNIWVKNGNNENYMEEPTLRTLTKEYKTIIIKHCFPVCNIKENLDSADINSKTRTLDNYKLQYDALKKLFHKYPNNNFIVFTGAAQVKSQITKEEAIRAKQFFDWVVNSWDIKEDNIYIWDLYSLQTEDSIYFKEDFARSETDSHPNKKFAEKASKLLFQRILDILKTGGKSTLVTGEKS